MIFSINSRCSPLFMGVSSYYFRSLGRPFKATVVLQHAYRCSVWHHQIKVLRRAAQQFTAFERRSITCKQLVQLTKPTKRTNDLRVKSCLKLSCKTIARPGVYQPHHTGYPCTTDGSARDRQAGS